MYYLLFCSVSVQAYQTFANRVSNLKRKLDALKATLPDSDESPVPSPLEDAPSPSPSASESSFQGLGHPQRTKDEKNSEDAEKVEDMDASDKHDTPKTPVAGEFLLQATIRCILNFIIKVGNELFK